MTHEITTLWTFQLADRGVRFIEEDVALDVMVDVPEWSFTSLKITGGRFLRSPIPFGEFDDGLLRKWIDREIARLERDQVFIDYCVAQLDLPSLQAAE